MTDFPLSPVRRAGTAGRLSLRWVGCVLLALCPALVVFEGGGVAQAEWLHSGGDLLGTGHVDGVGAFTGDAASEPAVSWLLQLPATDFSVQEFADVDGDGEVEMLRIFQQRLGAFDLLTGDLVWATPPLGLSDLKGFADTDGDGSADEVIVVSRPMGGGIHAVDLRTGALVGSFTGLAYASGVRADEVSIADVDGDGADELVFAADLRFTDAFHLLDFSTVDGVGRLAETSLGGYYLQLTRGVAADFDGDGLQAEFLTLQADWIDLKRACAADAAGASCDTQDGTVCLCDVALIEDAFAARLFPVEPLALDTDGDGADELVTIHRHGTHARGFGVLEVGTYFDGSKSPALGGWLYDYSHQSEGPVPFEPDGAPRDLDGDGHVELGVTVWNASTGELGLDGAVVEDGLDHAGGYSVGVYSATGGLLASLSDTVLHGYADLNGNGRDELVVETTAGGQISGGHAQGWELSCSGGTCSLQMVWASTAHRLTRFPEAYDGVGTVGLSLLRLDVEADGFDELLLWTENGVETCRWDGTTGLATVGSLALQEDVEIAGFQPGGNRVVVNDEGLVTVHSGDLELLSTLLDQPSGEVPRWFAAKMTQEATRATPFVEGYYFQSTLVPLSLLDADAEVRPDLVLLQDVDGDGLTDVFSSETIDATGAFVLARHEADGAGGLELAWEWSTESPDDLRPLLPRTLWSFTAADVTADGVDDIVFSLEHKPGMAMLAVDGASGQTVWTAPFSDPLGTDAHWAPIAAVDVCSASGYGITDDVLDFVRPTRREMTAWQVGEAAPDAQVEYPATDHSGQFTFGDLNGDGNLEAVTARLFNVIDPALQAWSLLPSIEPLWAETQTDVPLPPWSAQGLALASIDSSPGHDVVVVSASGAVDAFAGATGQRISGFPIYLKDGLASTVVPAQRQPLVAVVTGDLDGDGSDEAVAASRSGYVYGVDLTGDVEAGTEPQPVLDWVWYGGTPIAALAAADVDGDEQLEVLVSAADGTARVLDALGIRVDIVRPQAEDCITNTTTEVCGTSAGVDWVDLHVQGVAVATEVAVDDDGDWCVDIAVPAIEGMIEILALGMTAGVPAVSDQLLIVSANDSDGDGVTICGGDCDDNNPLVAPDLPELCDGLDNDCDSTTSENDDLDGDLQSPCEGDCDDSLPLVYAGAPENCTDGLDTDCDGISDELDPDCDVAAAAPAATALGEGCSGCRECGVAAPQPGTARSPAVPLSAWVLGLALLCRRRRSRMS